MTLPSPQPSPDLITSEVGRKMQDLSMKLSISRDNLAAALQTVGRAVSSRATLPSLGGIELAARPDGIVLRATDMELGLTVFVGEATVEAEGTVLLPGSLIGDVVRSLPPGDVTLALQAQFRRATGA